MPLMTPDEVAQELRVPVGRLDRWRWHGVGPAFVVVEKAIMYHPDDVHAYIAANRKIPALQAQSETAYVTARKAR